jgi:hypothetical protein
MRDNFDSDNGFKGMFGLAIFAWFISFLLGLAFVGGIGYVLYTIVTKPEVLANWIKVVTGG